MGIDGTVHGKDRVGSNFISAVFLRVPAEEVIAIVGRSRQACQFSGHSHGTGLAYVTTVGVKGHGVGVGRPLGIEVQISVLLVGMSVTGLPLSSGFSYHPAKV